MTSPSTFKRMQADQARAYLAAVTAVEARLGVALPRFRDVKFCLADYQKPADLGQAPYYRLFPGLTAKPYWDAADWPAECRAILAQFEENHPALLAEFEAGIPRAREAFRGQSTGYFGVADRWLSYALVEETGEPVPEAFAAFPRLARILAALVEHKLPCKTYFALMRPGVHLPEHCGGHNIALRMHFALRIPPGDTGIRVQGIDRRWEDGKCLYFDDTFVHEAWNRTEEDRYILLMRLLHPELSPLERGAYFLIEEEFRRSEIFVAMKEEILAAKAVAARSVTLSSTAPSPTSPWVLEPHPRTSPFLASAGPATTRGTTRGATTGAFPQPRWVSSAISQQLYPGPAPRWTTFASNFESRARR